MKCCLSHGGSLTFAFLLNSHATSFLQHNHIITTYLATDYFIMDWPIYLSFLQLLVNRRVIYFVLSNQQYWQQVKAE